VTNKLKPKLFVHIGGAKCGSSTIQYYLKTNIAELYSQGFIIPDVEMCLGGGCLGEQLQYFEGCKKDLNKSKSELHQRLLDIVDKYYSKNKNAISPKIIVSAENLSCWNDFSTLFEATLDEFDVKIIIYIRRQDEYLLSFWQQWYLKVEEDFWSWTLNHLKIIGDWYYTIKPWVDLYGKERVIVRILSRKTLEKESLVYDFAKQLCIDAEHTDADINENISFNDAVVGLASSVSDVFDGMHDNRFYNMVAEWGGSATFKKNPSHLITIPQRKALMFFYSDSNKKIKNMFFSELGDNDLFDPVDESVSNYDASSSVDGRVEVLTRLIYGLYLKRDSEITMDKSVMTTLNKIKKLLKI